MSGFGSQLMRTAIDSRCVFFRAGVCALLRVLITNPSQYGGIDVTSISNR